MNAWFGDPRTLAKAARPALDIVTSRSLARLRSLADEPTSALPAALVLATSLPVALLVGVPTAGVGIGVALGLLIAAGVAAYARLWMRKNAKTLARAIAEAQADADQRVVVVTRQYEWAVNDVANLRDALRRTRAQSPTPTSPNGSAATTRSRAPVRLLRFVRESDPPTTLRFGAEGLEPQQVRILERGNVVAISARSLEPALGIDMTFAIRVSEKLAAAFAHRATGVAIEALIDEQWHPAEIHTPVAPSEMRDKRAHVWRAGSAEEGARL